MNFTEHLNLYKRNWLLILITAVFVFMLAYTVGSKKIAGGFEGTIFLTVGTERLDSADPSTSYDDALAADNFSETVSGWFKNPVIINKISEIAGTDAALSGRRQERLNVVVTYSTSTQREAEAIATATEQVIGESIQEFNAETNRQFTIARYESQVNESASKASILLLVALVFGLAAGIGLAYAQEYARGTASWTYQISNILNKDVDFHLSAADLKKMCGSLPSLMKHTGFKHAVIAGVNFDPSAIAKVLSESEPVHDANPVTLPGNTELNHHTVLICKLGTSKLTELQNIKKILPDKFLLVSYSAWS